MRTCQFTRGGFLVGFLVAAGPAPAGAQAAAVQHSQPATGSDTADVALIDPSLRATLAVATWQVAAEMAENRKQATAKAGFDLSSNWTGEAGFTGVFHQDGLPNWRPRLRDVTTGSSAWAAATWKQHRLRQPVTPLLGIKLQASRAAFDYYDMALSAHNESRTNYAVTATAGVLTSRDVVLAVNYRWGESWSADNESARCQTVVSTGVTRCPVDRIFRAPVPQLQQQLEGHVAAHLGDRIGAEAFVTRDLQKRAWGLEVPVYFMSRPNGGFAGGLVVHYNGYHDAFDLSLFIGQVFTLSK